MRIFVAAGPVFAGIRIYFYSGYGVERPRFTDGGRDCNGEGGGVYGWVGFGEEAFVAKTRSVCGSRELMEVMSAYRTAWFPNLGL